MRIVSLLPSATEIVCAIGLAATSSSGSPTSATGRRRSSASRSVTRSVQDLSDASSREIHRPVRAAMHGGSSLYALDEEALAAAEPDLILTQELCRVCAVSYREVNEVARAIDADITVVSLEPTSIEGILNTITTVGAMAEAEDAAIDLVESLRERLGAVEARSRRGARPAPPPRVVGLEWLDPPFAVGHWVPEQIRRAGGWDLLGADGEKAHPDDMGRGRRGRSRDALPHAVRLPPRRDRGRVGADTRARRGSASWRPSTAARSSRVDGSAYFAGPGRGSSTGSSCWPRSSTRTGSSTSRRPAAGRRSRSADDAVPRDVRLPVVRDRPHRPRPRRPGGLGAALPRLRRQGRRQRLPAVPAAPGPDRARAPARAARPRAAAPVAGAAAAATPTRAPTPPAADRRRRRPRQPAIDAERRWSPTTRPAPPSTTTGTCAAAAMRAGRSTTPPGTRSSTRPAAGSTRCRSRRDRRARRRHRLVDAAPGSKGELSLYDARRAARASPRAAGRPRAPRPPARP